jgi:hypothetical protein
MEDAHFGRINEYIGALFTQKYGVLPVMGQRDALDITGCIKGRLDDDGVFLNGHNISIHLQKSRVNWMGVGGNRNVPSFEG